MSNTFNTDERFNLYEREGEENFRNYLKDNNFTTGERIVYVVQQPPAIINLSGALEYGKIAVCVSEKSQLIFSPGPFLQKLRRIFRDITPEDHLLLIGDPAIIALATCAVSERTSGQFNLLKWDRIARKYYPLHFDLYNKEEALDDQY